MKFHRAKFRVMNLGQGNPQYWYRVSAEWIECNPEEKDLGVLVDEKLDISQNLDMYLQPRKPTISEEAWLAD